MASLLFVIGLGTPISDLIGQFPDEPSNFVLRVLLWPKLERLPGNSWRSLGGNGIEPQAPWTARSPAAAVCARQPAADVGRGFPDGAPPDARLAAGCFGDSGCRHPQSTVSPSAKTGGILNGAGASIYRVARRRRRPRARPAGRRWQ